MIHRSGASLLHLPDALYFINTGDLRSLQSSLFHPWQPSFSETAIITVVEVRYGNEVEFAKRHRGSENELRVNDKSRIQSFSRASGRYESNQSDDNTPSKQRQYVAKWAACRRSVLSEHFSSYTVYQKHCGPNKLLLSCDFCSCVITAKMLLKKNN